jgi:hypothetical protein
MFLHQTYITYTLYVLYYKFTPTNTVCFLFHKNSKNFINYFMKFYMVDYIIYIVVKILHKKI